MCIDHRENQDPNEKLNKKRKKIQYSTLPLLFRLVWFSLLPFSTWFFICDLEQYKSVALFVVVVVSSFSIHSSCLVFFLAV